MEHITAEQLKAKYSVHRHKNSKSILDKIMYDERYMLFSNNKYVNFIVHLYIGLMVWSDAAEIYYQITDGGALFIDIFKVITYPIMMLF
jgi:hypothetical protein